MNKAFIVILGLLGCFQTTATFGWGSLTGFETHQFILKVAYEELERDPNFTDAGFPTLEQILAHEGVYYISDGILGGPGPDKLGETPDSWHYYNPRIRMGGAPEASSRYFGYYYKGSSSNASDTVKHRGLAWGAHFLADMSVPYHVVGLPKSELDTFAKDPITGELFSSVPFGETYTDDRYAMNYQSIVGHPVDFGQEVGRFYADSATRSNGDWFDPWYWNGVWPASVKESSHLQWEAFVFHNFQNPNVMIQGYSPDWKNPEPSFNVNWDAYQEQVSALAIRSAENTRNKANMKAWLSDASPALSQAARDVYTVWRSTFTGLRGFVSASPDFNQLGKKIFTLKAYVGNLNKEIVRDVRVKVTPLKGCEATANGWPSNGELRIGDIEPYEPSNAVGEVSGWSLHVPDIRNCDVRVEIIGKYEETPDAQYFKHEEKPEGLSEAVFYNGNVSGTFTANDYSGGFYFNQGTVILRGNCMYNGMICDMWMTGTVNADKTINGYFQTQWTVPSTGEIKVIQGTTQGFLNEKQLQVAYIAKKPNSEEVIASGMIDLKNSRH